MKEIKEREISPIPHFQPQIKNLDCQKEKIIAFLADGRELSIPITWFARLRNATLDQLKNYQVLPDGYDIHWSEIDEDISLRVFTDGLHSGCC